MRSAVGRLFWVATAVAIPVVGCRTAPEPLNEKALLGTWAGEAEHNGQGGRFFVRFAHDSDGTISATLSLPSMGAWDVPAGVATIHDGEVHVGSWVLRWNPVVPALEGRLPASLVPVYEIGAVLTRSDPVEPEPISVDAPLADPVWTLDVGAPIWAGVAHDGGTIYGGADSGELFALDAADGGVRWRAATEGAIRARPTVDGGRLFVPSDDGNLYRIDTPTGAVVWKMPIVDEAYERGGRFDHYASAAALVSDTVFIGSPDGSVRALDADSGEQYWRFAASDAVASTPVVASGRVYVGSFDGNVYALHAATGESLWERSTGAAIPSSAAFANDHVVIGSRSYDLLALDAKTGTPLWTRYYWFSWVDSDPVIVDETVYIGSSDALCLFAFDLTSGEPRWSFRTGGWTWPQPAVTDNAVYVGTVGTADYIGPRYGGFFAVDRKDGTPLWQYAAEQPDSGDMWGFASYAVAAADKVFVGGLDGRLYAFSQRMP